MVKPTTSQKNQSQQDADTLPIVQDTNNNQATAENVEHDDTENSYEKTLKSGIVGIVFEWSAKKDQTEADCHDLGFKFVEALSEIYPFEPLLDNKVQIDYIPLLYKQIINLLELRRLSLGEEDAPGNPAYSINAFLDGVLGATATQNLIAAQAEKPDANKTDIDICYDCLRTLYEVLYIGEEAIQEAEAIT